MARIVLLDAGVVGLLASEPDKPSVVEGLNWLRGVATRYDVAIPDIPNFEVRRELLRLRASRKLIRLDDLKSWLIRVEVTQDAWLKAAEFWAGARQAG